MYIACPFCKEEDFDAIGLKLHLREGGCSAYNDIENWVTLAQVFSAAAGARQFAHIKDDAFVNAESDPEKAFLCAALVEASQKYDFNVDDLLAATVRRCSQITGEGE